MTFAMASASLFHVETETCCSTWNKHLPLDGQGRSRCQEKVLLHAAFESGRKHLDFPDAAAAGDIQGAFLRTTERQALAVLIVARHADDTKLLALGTEDLHAR